MKIFANREQAGRELARRLHRETAYKDAIVFALPRGGVPVGYAIAETLHLPLDIVVVRKLGVPAQPELAMGAIASGGVVILNDDIVKMIGGSRELVSEVEQTERRELARRERIYRSGIAEHDISGHAAILVDDGAATGATMRAAIRAVRLHYPKLVIVALPTISVEAFRMLQLEADQLVCLQVAEPFHSVGEWYRDFDQTTDEQVTTLLSRAQSIQVNQTA